MRRALHIFAINLKRKEENFEGSELSIPQTAYTHGQQEVTGMEASQVRNATRIDIVKILQSGTSGRRLQLHQRRRRLCAAQNESKSSFGTMKKLFFEWQEERKAELINLFALISHRRENKRGELESKIDRRKFFSS
jgi:hypothetical protein